MLREQARIGWVIRIALEEALVAALLLMPKRICAAWLRRRISRYVFGCAASDVYLYKSGRAALRGLMDTIRIISPNRQVAFVPDYVCNVVGDSCRASGFRTVVYPTDARCLPEWKTLSNMIRNEPAPVVVFCSQFGSVPSQAPEAGDLERVSPNVFIVADECQNLILASPIKARHNRAVVFSFNDKTCPGLMGGGVVWPRAGTAPLAFVQAPFLRRSLCSLALIRLWLLRISQITIHLARLAIRRPPAYKIPDSLEYSVALKPHYDLVPEPIYRLSVARACVSLLFLGSYRRVRLENIQALQTGFRGLQAGFDTAAPQSGPPFLPLFSQNGRWPETFPCPIKAGYGTSPTITSRSMIAARINVPYVRYESGKQAIVQLTSRHSITDNRILHGMAKTLDAAGYISVILGPAPENQSFGRIELRACPVLKNGHPVSAVKTLVRLFVGALKSRFGVFQIHDPDLLPVGLLLKLCGRRIVYDVHDDYEASWKVRLRGRRYSGRVIPPLWWWFEKNVARLFDGVVVADRHLAKKFARLNPVILGNYPRLAFTPPAMAENEATFNLIYVGGVTRERGLGMILKALQLLPLPDLRLHVIGTSTETDLLDLLRAEPRVILHGRVSWSELHRHYVRAHAGLALYQPLESFLYSPGENAVKVVEYMAAGIPVICSNFPGLKIFVEEAGCGLTVQPDDPHAIAATIQRLVDDAVLRRKLGATGRRLFESTCNWEKHEHLLIDYYSRIIHP